MKKTTVRLISLFLTLIFIISCLGCTPTKNTEKSTEAVDTEQLGNSEKSFALSDEYHIVSHSMYKGTLEIANSLSLLRTALSKSCGVNATFDTDNTSKGTTPNTNKYEILIGYTNRKETQEVISGLGINDYTYHVVSKNVIVICGGSVASTLKATEKFCADVLGYDSKTGSASKTDAKINEGASFTHKEKYEYNSFLINDLDITDYTIAINTLSEMPYAQKILAKFGQYTGYSLPIVKITELDGTEKGVISIGSYTRKKDEGYELLSYGGEIKFTVDESGTTIGIDFTGKDYFDIVMSRFNIKSVLKKDLNSGKATLSLPKENIAVNDLDKVYAKLPKWTLVKEIKEEVRDGVTYLEHHYVGSDAKPYKAYILMLDPSKVSLYMGSGKDSYDAAPEKDMRQSVLGHMQSAAENNVNVIAGVNGDFFNISGNYAPSGLAIKEGDFISQRSTSRPFFAFTNDGQAVIEKGTSHIDVSKYRTSVGGSNIIVLKGLPNDLGLGTDFGDTFHPRTLAGIKEDGTIILAVIDGRQRSLSNGATLALCARFMISLGAIEAINLDGGGSSTMIVRKDTEYDVKNSPSDGSLRKVYNSLLVVAKN